MFKPQLMSQCLIVFVANSVMAVLISTNGCGNYFALGTPYGETLQECETLLQTKYGVDYFSQSTPIIFDDLAAILLVNFVLFLFFRRSRTKNGTHTTALWVSAFLGFITPRVAIQFLQ